MKLLVNQELRDICTDILAKDKSELEWSEIESDDMFQTESIEGGYDADEHAFCFSYYDDNRTEYWFQLTIQDVVSIAEGSLEKIQIRVAEPY